MIQVMIYLANREFFRKVFILKFFFFLINLCFSQSYADIVKSFDLMPFENNASIFELNLGSYSNNFFPNTLGSATINSIKLDQNLLVFSQIGTVFSGHLLRLYLIMKFNVMRVVALLLVANQTFVTFRVKVSIHHYKMEFKTPQFL